MNPTKVSRGSSFKGAAAYVMTGHIGQENPDRVDWSATQNVGTDSAEIAARIMAATYYDADQIKRANGSDGRGRPTTKKPVLHMTLSWDEGQQPDAAHMEKTARDFLKHVGLEKAQAIMAGHNDSDHAHLHIIVNMIDPETGKNIDLGNDKRKMQSFALDYCRAHGIESSPNREKNAAARAEAARTGDTSILEGMQGRKRLSRDEWLQMKAQLLDRQSAEREALKVQQGADWAKVKSELAARQAQERAQWRVESERQRAILKAENRPQWSEIYKVQEREKRAALVQIKQAEEAHRRASTLLARGLAAIGIGPTRSETAQRVTEANLRAYELRSTHKAQLEAKRRAQAETRSKRTAEAIQQWRAARPIDRTAIDRMKAGQQQQWAELRAQHHDERAKAGIRPQQERAAPREPDNRHGLGLPPVDQVRAEADRQERLRDGITRAEQIDRREGKSKWGDRPLSDDTRKAGEQMRERDEKDRRSRDDHGRER